MWGNLIKVANLLMASDKHPMKKVMCTRASLLLTSEMEFVSEEIAKYSYNESIGVHTNQYRDRFEAEWKEG